MRPPTRLDADAAMPTWRYRRRLSVLGEPPLRAIVASERHVLQSRANHLDRHPPTLKNRIVELTIRHPPRSDQLAMQCTKLKPADHVRDLIQGRIRSVERAPYFRLRIRALVTNALDEEIHRFLRRHRAEVESE